jgi:putative transposase
MPVGWEIMPTENTECISAALRRAIITLGKIPAVVYLDNGKAFKSKFFTDKNIDFESAGFRGLYARLGIETIFAWPYNAASKPIERFFGTFSEMERLMPTYSGTSISTKPARLLRNEKLHKKIYQKKYGDWCPTILQTNKIIAGWVNKYSQREHTGIRGQKPGDIFLAGKGPGVDQNMLSHMMMAIQDKPIGRNGIKLFDAHYYDESLYGLKDRVMVRYDINNLDTIKVYNHTGEILICEAGKRSEYHPIARITGDEADVEQLKAGIKQKRALKRKTEQAARDYVNTAPDLIGVDFTQITAQAPAEPVKKFEKLTSQETEKIESEVIRLGKEICPGPAAAKIYDSEIDRYEDLIFRKANDEIISDDDDLFMRYFRKTDVYSQFSERLKFIEDLNKQERASQ